MAAIEALATGATFPLEIASFAYRAWSALRHEGGSKADEGDPAER